MLEIESLHHRKPCLDSVDVTFDMGQETFHMTVGHSVEKQGVIKRVQDPAPSVILYPCHFNTELEDLYLVIDTYIMHISAINTINISRCKGNPCQG